MHSSKVHYSSRLHISSLWYAAMLMCILCLQSAPFTTYLPTYYILHTAYYILHTAYCMLHTTYYIPHATYYTRIYLPVYYILYTALHTSLPTYPILHTPYFIPYTLHCTPRYCTDQHLTIPNSRWWPSLVLYLGKWRLFFHVCSLHLFGIISTNGL